MSPETFIPLIKPLFLAYVIFQLNPFITNMNSNGDKEHRCCSPREELKKVVGSPLMIITMFVATTHIIILCMFQWFMPILYSANRKYF